MVKVLVITGILPVDSIAHKQNENDIILTTEENICGCYNDICFHYLFTFPYANKFLSFFSDKWKSYHSLTKKGTIEVRGRNVGLFPQISLPRNLFFRRALLDLSLLFFESRIDKIIKEFTPTIIHAQDTEASAYIARRILKKYGVPYIVTLRGLPNRTNFVKDNLLAAKKLIAVSPRQVLEGKTITTKHISLIPHGINSIFFENNVRERSDGEPLRLVIVARLVGSKNIDLIINALSCFKEDFILDIYGTGPKLDELIRLTDGLGLNNRISFKGLISNSELPRAFHKYHLFIMCSFPETLGRVYFEAMANGLPVIASRNTGIDGLITNGHEGYLLDPKSLPERFTKELVDILKRITSHRPLLSELSYNALKTAQKYSWETVSPKYYNIYRNI